MGKLIQRSIPMQIKPNTVLEEKVISKIGEADYYKTTPIVCNRKNESIFAAAEVNSSYLMPEKTLVAEVFK